MRQFPFTTRRNSIVLLRISLGIVFMAHAAVRIANNTIPEFSLFLSNKGFPFSTATVWAITIYEIAGSALLAAGILIRWLSAGFILMLLAGIILIHASLGWFVGEHGTGGSEYSFILMICLIVVATASASEDDLKNH